MSSKKGSMTLYCETFSPKLTMNELGEESRGTCELDWLNPSVGKGPHVYRIEITLNKARVRYCIW